MSLFLSVGEISGDFYGKALLEALFSRGYTGIPEGMLGPASASAGARSLWSSEELHIMGFSDVPRALPRLFKLLHSMTEHILKTSPKAVLLVDSPDFHLPLAKKLRRKGYGGALLNIAPPAVWAWRRGRVKQLRKYYDCCFPLFPFEHELLLRKGVPSVFCGHPFLEEHFFSQPPAAFSGEKFSSLALLPGSRESEVRHNLPVLQEAFPLLLEKGVRPWISVAPGLSKKARELLVEAFPGEYRTEEPGRELIKRTDALMGACGTVATEALLLNRYMVVLYRMSGLNWSILSLLRKLQLMGVEYGAVPNLLAGYPVYPELLQHQARGASAVALLEAYEGSRELRQKIHRRMEEARKRLGTPGAFDLWAEKILEYLE
ncbi:MAG TPA: lipid-A-disaccharide synthase [Synergistaceae bacterium]|nr:lipid-A-disaccharide synthase [Synergistaceae bacterium]HPJ24665.1 lipid-A-disaccharide synthase [Synergistaceae bacterium]